MSQLATVMAPAEGYSDRISFLEASISMLKVAILAQGTTHGPMRSRRPFYLRTTLLSKKEREKAASIPEACFDPREKERLWLAGWLAGVAIAAIITILKLETMIVASGHTASNAPDLFRTPKLSGAGPG